MAVLDFLVNLAQGLSKFFADAGAEFLAWTTDIVPLALVALTVLNAIVSLIGEDRFDSFARKLTKNVFARYTLLPYLANFLTGSPLPLFSEDTCTKNINLVFMRLTTAQIWLHDVPFPHVNPANCFGLVSIMVLFNRRKGRRTIGCLHVPISFRTSSLIGLTVENGRLPAKWQGIDWKK